MSRQVVPLVLALVTAVSVPVEAQDSTGARAEHPETSFHQLLAGGLARGRYRLRGEVIYVERSACAACPPRAAACGPCPFGGIRLRPTARPTAQDSVVRVLVHSAAPRQRQGRKAELEAGRSYLLTVEVTSVAAGSNLDLVDYTPLLAGGVPDSVDEREWFLDSADVDPVTDRRTVWAEIHPDSTGARDLELRVVCHGSGLMEGLLVSPRAYYWDTEDVGLARVTLRFGRGRSVLKSLVVLDSAPSVACERPGCAQSVAAFDDTRPRVGQLRLTWFVGQVLAARSLWLGSLMNPEKVHFTFGPTTRATLSAVYRACRRTLPRPAATGPTGRPPSAH